MWFLLVQLVSLAIFNMAKIGKKSKQKRVEYQKFVRTKLEQKRYLGLFGLTDNIALVGEEDLVIQREFRIDFVLQKIRATIPINGIFSHFKQYNLLEFKSINDPLTTILLIKYIGQLFWWLYAKNTEAKKDKSTEIREDSVTLNIVTVSRPRNVINKLDELLNENFIRHGGGHYECNVMGVKLHIFAINEFPIEREYYGWLVFSEGKQYEKFKNKLAREIEKNEEYQVYLELINELEKEGSEKMAYDILRKIFNDLPLEQQQSLSYEILKRTFSRMSVKEQQEFVSPNVLKRTLSGMPAKQKQETIRDVLAQMSKEERQEIIEQL